MLENVIGFMAVFTSTISLLPQIYKAIVSKSTEDLSSLMLVNFVLSSAMWIWYGLLTMSWAVWATNILMLIFALILAYIKFKFEKVSYVKTK